MVTSDAAVRRYVAVVRRDVRPSLNDTGRDGDTNAAGGSGSKAGGVPAKARSAAPAAVPSPRATAWLLRNADAAPDRLTLEEAAYVAALCEECPALAEVRRRAKAFTDLLAAHDANALSPWLNAADNTELRSFAAGICRDQDAVLAAILFPWRNGQVEGQVNRLKLVKRMMYCRAGLALLRRRVVAAA
jgi:transposase